MLAQTENLLEKGEDLPSSQQSPSRTSTAGRTLIWALQSLRPSLFDKSTRKTRLRRTAYIDGLRGFAALLVYIIHHELWAHEAQQADRRLQSAYGARGDYLFAALPFVRTFFTGGHIAVAVFFVVSGYCLSAKPLALIHVGDYVALGDNVASALFRRWFRLYLPIIFVTFAIVTLSHWTGISFGFVPEASYRAELWKWFVELKNYSFIYGVPKKPWFHYHAHIWTIPIELKGSVIVYATSMALSRCTQKARLWCEVGLIFYFMYIVDGAHYSMFVAGMLLCDIDSLATLDMLPSWFSRLERFSTPIFYLMFVAGIYLGGVPSFSLEMDFLRESPGWYYMSYLKPQANYDFKWFYNFWAALLVVSSVPRIPWAKNFFETRFCQYLGRISYMFYLMHGPVLWTLGDRLYAAVGWSRESHALILPGWSNKFPIPKAGPLGAELGFILPNLILLPITLWLADRATAFIDDPAIKFGSLFYKRTLPESREVARP
ncbi:hypothetical protein MBLNU459_g2356t1 [Dothideomycetes sp. NU459]